MGESTLRVGVVGAGLIAEAAHLPAWATVADADVVAIVDVDESKAKRVASAFGVREWFNDYRQLLEREDIGALDICLPPALHASCVVDALQAGKHVLLEKPFVRNLDEADQVLAVEAEASGILMVAENWPFSSAAAHAGRLLERGALGNPFLLKAHHESSLYLKDLNPSMPDWQLNAQAAAGGYLMNAGIHTVNLARSFLGDFSSLTAYATSKGESAEPFLDFDAVLAGQFQQGSIASMNFTGRSRHVGERRLGVSVFGDEGSVEIDILSGSIVETIGSIQTHTMSRRVSMGYREEIGHFVAACEGAPMEPGMSAREQRSTLATVLAAYRSIYEQLPVDPQTAGHR